MTEDINKFRIIKILRSFDMKEFSGFEKFLHSPLHNQYKTLRKLFTILKPYYPGFENKNLTREKVFLKVNSSKKYDHLLFNKYMSDMSKLAEEFIVQAEFKDQTEEKNIYLLDYYRKRDLNDLYNQTLSRIEKAKVPDLPAGNDIFLNKHKLEHIKGNQYFKTQKPKLQFESLIKSQDNLMKYFLGLSTFHLKCLYVHKYSFKNYIHKNSINAFWNNFDFENFIKSLDLNGFEKRSSHIKLL